MEANAAPSELLYASSSSSKQNDGGEDNAEPGWDVFLIDFALHGNHHKGGSGGGKAGNLADVSLVHKGWRWGEKRICIKVRMK